MAAQRARSVHAVGRLLAGIRVGNPADLVMSNAKTPAEAIATVAQPLMGFKRGRRLFKRELAVLERP